MSFFRFGVSIGSGWRQSLEVLYQQLRRISFVIDSTFSFGDFDPLTSFSGMTVTNYTVYRARYLKIFNMLWLSVDISATVAAPFSNIITVGIPSSFLAAGQTAIPNDTASNQGGFAVITNAGTAEPGYWLVNHFQAVVYFFRGAGGNFSAGTARITGNFYLETT